MNTALCALVISCGVLVGAASPPHRVVIKREAMPICFEVEVADDLWSRARGLMHRDHPPDGQGMLFLYDALRPVTFWMKNVAMPLDLIFIDETGHVVRIMEHAKPGDVTPIVYGSAVSAVLEIAGGASRRAQIKESGRVKTEQIENMKLACAIAE